MSSPLGDLEQLLLFAIVRLGGSASGAEIRDEVADRTGRTVSPGAIYTVMSRLEDRGLVTGGIDGPAPSRGGRRRKFYRIQPGGAVALQSAYDQVAQMADGALTALRSLTEGER